MNKVYKVIYCKATQTMVAVSEFAKGHSKNSTRDNRVRTVGVFGGRLKVLSAVVMLALGGQAYAACSTNGANGHIECLGNVNGQNGIAIGSESEALQKEGIAIGHNSHAAGDQSVVLGNDAQAEGKFSIVIGTQWDNPSFQSGIVSTGDNAVAIGGGHFEDDGRHSAYVEGDNSVALGTSSHTTELAVSSIAVGDSAEAGNQKAIALGYKANASGLQSIAMGDETVSSANNTIAIGHKTEATANDATVVGREAKATEKDSVAVGYLAAATADSAVAVGKGSQGAGRYTTSVGLDSRASGQGSVAIGSGAGAGAAGAAPDSFVVATALGNDAKANADKSVALGRMATADGFASVALGESSVATASSGVALGEGSVADVDSGKTGVDPLEAGENKDGSTWKSTAGAVSVGKGTEKTRQITSVAAGTRDTDAVNVAQLKAAGFKLTTSASDGEVVGNSEEKVKNGDMVTIDAGKNIKITQAGPKVTVATKDEVEFTKTTVGNVVTDATTNKITGLEAGTDDKDAVNVAQLKSATQTYFHVNENDATQGVGDAATNLGGIRDKAGATGKFAVTAGVNAKAKHQGAVAIGHNAEARGLDPYGSVAVGADARALGFGSVAIGKSSKVKPGTWESIAIGSRTFASQKETVVIGSDVEANGTQSIVIGHQSGVRKNGEWVPPKSSDGDFSVAIGSGTGRGAAAQYAAEADGKYSIVMGTDAKSETAAESGVAIGRKSKAEVALGVALGSESVSKRNALTAGAATSNAADATANTVYAMDTAEQADKEAISATVKGDLGAVSVGNDDKTRQIINVAAGSNDSDAVNVAQLKSVAKQAVAAKEDVKSDDGSVTVVKTQATDGSNIFDLSIQTDDDTLEFVPVDPADPSKGKKLKTKTADITTDADGKAVQGDDTSLATAKDVAEAINASFWKTTSANDGGELDGTQTVESIKAGDTVTFKAGKNIKLKQDGANFTYSLRDDLTGLKSTQFVDAGGNDTIKIDGNAKTITGLDDTITTPADPTQGTAPVGDQSGKVATVNDILNSGWNLQENNKAKDLVNPYDTVNFADGTGTKVEVETDGKKSTIKVNVDAQSLAETAQLPVVYTDKNGNKVYKQDDGTFDTKPDGSGDTVAPADIIASMQNADGTTNNPSTLANVNSTIGHNNGEGAINEADAKKATGDLLNQGDNLSTAATVGDLQAIAQAGLDFSGDDATNIHKPLGTKLEILGGADKTKLTDNNIGVNEDGGTLKVQLAKDLTGLDSVVLGTDATDPNTVALTKGGINAGSKKITNVADGDISPTSKDAVNGSQIHNIADKNATNVFGGNATVNPDGSTSFTDIGGTGEDNINDAIQSINNSAANANKGFKIAGNSDVATDEEGRTIKPTETLTVVGDTANTDFDKSDKGKNIYTQVSDNKITVALAKDIEVDSVKAGDTTINNDGLTINGGPSVTKAGIDAGGKKITNVADGDIGPDSKDAVNGSQLYDLGDSTANALGGTSKFDPKTGKVTAGLSVGGNQYDNVQDALTGLNATASAHNTTTAGKNIEVVETPNADGGIDYEVKTKDEVEFNKVTAKKVTGLDAGTADKDAVNVSQLKGIAGAIGGGSTVNPDGTIKQPEFTLTDGDPNSGNNKIYNSVGDALGGLNTAVNQPLTFKGDEGNTSEQKLGSTFEIVAGNAKDTSVDNLKTKVEDGKVTISMADAPTFKGKVSAKGVDAGGERITNVAPGREPTDAVNVSQLKNTAGKLYNAIGKVDDNASAGSAAGMAAANLPQPHDPGASMVSAAVGAYRNQQALAIGVSTISDNGRWVIKGSLTRDTKDHTGAGVGVGYQW